MQRPSVLILADDPAFAREITANWPEAQPSGHSPEFTLLDKGFCSHLDGDQYDLAIVDASSISKAGSAHRREPGKRMDVDEDLKRALVAVAKPAILIHSGSGRESFKAQGPIVEICREAKTWPALTGFVGREIYAVAKPNYAFRKLINFVLLHKQTPHSGATWLRCGPTSTDRSEE